MRRQLNLAVEEFIVADVLIGDARIASLVKSGWADRIRGRGKGTISLHPSARGRRGRRVRENWRTAGR